MGVWQTQGDTQTQTHTLDDGIYRTSIVLRGKMIIYTESIFARPFAKFW